MKINLLKWLLASFENNKEGASARKLSAFALMICVFYLHWKFVTAVNAIEFLLCDLSSIGVLLGIVTMQNVIDLKTEKKNASN